MKSSQIICRVVTILVGLAFLGGSNGLAQVGDDSPVQRPEASSDNQPTVIPFTLTKWNNISIAAKVNEKESVNLMFHTANQSVVLTIDAVKRMKHIAFGQTGTANSWGGSSSMRFSKGNTLQIGDQIWKDRTIYEDKLSGRSTDGKFGPNLFAGKIIQLDFEQSRLLLYDGLPTLDDDYEKLKFEVRNGAMFVKAGFAIDGKTYSNELMVHSGYSGAMLLDDAFAEKHQLAEKLKTVSESELRDSYGNVLKTIKVVLPTLQLGKIQFTDVTVGIFAGSIQRQKMSVLGSDLLKRMDIVIDSENSEIYLRPNKFVNEEYFK